jgi:hypothetical protein
MVTLNTNVRFQHRNGDFIRTAGLSTFWASVGNPDPFDPRCAYDPLSDRWITIACANRFQTNSALLVGVSQSNDPTGAWQLYRISAGGGTNWIDFPTLGFNKNWIVVQASMKTISGNQFAEAQVYVFTKATLYATAGARHRLFRSTEIGTTQTAAITYDPELPLLYLVNSPVNQRTTQTLKIFTISGAIGSEVLSLAHTIEAPKAWATKAPGTENLAPQLNSTNRIHLQDSSIQNVVYQNGSLWCSQHIFLPPEQPTRSAIQWWQLSPDKILQLGRIDDPNGVSFFGYPSLAVNRSNDVLIGYTRFATTNYASAAYSFRLASDPRGEMRSDRIYKPGEASYFKTRNTGKNRWGDYSSTIMDPADNLSFWTLQAYAAAADGDPQIDGSGRWGTWWANIIPVFGTVDLEITGSGPSTADVNSPFSLEWKVKNNSTAKGSAFAFTSNLPDGVTLVSANASTGQAVPAGRSIQWMNDTLGPGETATLRLVLSSSASTPITHTADVLSFERDINTSNNSAGIVIAFASDSDGDGLPDEWERTNGLNPSDPADALSDPDRDGHTNRDEFLAGTDPNNAQSVLRLSVIDVTAAAVSITFPSVAGKLYRLEHKVNLLSGTWMELTELQGTGGTLRVSDTRANESQQGYYRVRVLR